MPKAQLQLQLLKNLSKFGLDQKTKKYIQKQVKTIYHVYLSLMTLPNIIIEIIMIIALSYQYYYQYNSIIYPELRAKQMKATKVVIVCTIAIIVINILVGIPYYYVSSSMQEMIQNLFLMNFVVLLWFGVYYTNRKDMPIFIVIFFIILVVFVFISYQLSILAPVIQNYYKTR